MKNILQLLVGWDSIGCLRIVGYVSSSRHSTSANFQRYYSTPLRKFEDAFISTRSGVRRGLLSERTSCLGVDFVYVDWLYSALRSVVKIAVEADDCQPIPFRYGVLVSIVEIESETSSRLDDFFHL